MYEWRVLRLGPGVLRRRILLGVVGWLALIAATAVLFGKPARIPALILIAGIAAMVLYVWLGLLVRLLRPGIFVAPDRIKIRNTLWTYVVLKSDVAGFEHTPVDSKYFAARGVEAIWLVRRDGRRIETQVQTRIPRDPFRRQDPGPKLLPIELDRAVASLNQWAGEGIRR